MMTNPIAEQVLHDFVSVIKMNDDVRNAFYSPMPNTIYDDGYWSIYVTLSHDEKEIQFVISITDEFFYKTDKYASIVIYEYVSQRKSGGYLQFQNQRRQSR